MMHCQKQVNLVANTTGFGAVKIDANLINAWGLAFGSTWALWSANYVTGTSTIYNKGGNTLLAPVNIPSPGGTTGGAPKGQSTMQQQISR